MKNFVFLLFTIVFSLNAFSQRIVQSLNTAWQFSIQNNINNSKIVNIPHTWNAQDPFEGGKDYFRGKGVYQKKIFVSEKWQNKQTFIKFEGSNQITTLFVNNVEVGKHIGGYTGFVFDITKFLNYGEENELKIEVDNSHHQDIPPLDADFNFYGGIYRDIQLINTDKVHFVTANEAVGNIKITTKNVSHHKAEVSIEAQVINHSSSVKEIMVKANLLDSKNIIIAVLKQLVTLQPQENKTITLQHTIVSPQLWSPETPRLYRAKTFITEAHSTKVLDQIASKFGLRWFSADPEKGFFLNGEPIKLIGANRHQDFEGLGNALPNALHRKDYKMIKAMGANFIRAAHYPQDPEVYKICDELGLLVWSEIPIINDVTDSEKYHDIALQMQREQILQFYNHPSVIMWGYMNEIFIKMVFNNKLSSKQKKAKIKTTVSLAKKLEKETKRLDATRLSVMALHENEIYNTSGIANIPDVIGWNLYFGWYSQGLENFGAFLDRQHQKYPDRLLFISEYGPGADVRIHTENPKPWDYSEDYQLQLHKSYINQVKERDYILGMSAWNFADFGSSFRQDSKPYLNQKGLVNFNRSPKDIYHYYQARLLKNPFVYIQGEHFTDIYLNNNQEKANFTVFSNAEEVNLQIGEVFTTAKVKDGLAKFKVALPEGTHKVIATAKGEKHERTFYIHYRSNLLKNIQQQPITVNVGTHVNFKDFLSDEVWLSDQPYSVGGFGYVGGNVFQPSSTKFQGTSFNIKGTQNNPLFQTMRESIEAYKFDVSEGEYRVTLYLTGPNSKASVENIYNLSSAAIEKVAGIRDFDIKINGKLAKENLNLARDYGALRAVTLAYDVSTTQGVIIEFTAQAGKTVLSAIKLEKL